jgi:hypothetical protein
MNRLCAFVALLALASTVVASPVEMREATATGKYYHWHYYVNLR